MNEVLAAVSILADLAQAASRIAGNLQVVSSIVLKAQSEGRDRLSDDEWKALEAIDDRASQMLLEKASERT